MYDIIVHNVENEMLDFTIAMIEDQLDGSNISYTIVMHDGVVEIIEIGGRRHLVVEN
jgi:hypothetical protein